MINKMMVTKLLAVIAQHGETSGHIIFLVLFWAD